VTRSVLVLRPEPGASATAARAAALHLDAIVAPLFTVVPLAWTAPDPSEFDALLLTSANAARQAGPQLARYSGLPVYAVGSATAAAARAAGLRGIVTGDADGATLVARAAADGIVRLLHLTGREHVTLDDPDVSIARRFVYAALAAERLPEPARVAIESGAVALLHSARAAATWRALLVADGLAPADIRIAAISPACLAAAGTGWRAAVAAESARDDALLAAAARLCD
jgi:uroporphyrinogen-III synthase